MSQFGRMGDEWLSLMRSSRGAVVQAAFDLPYPVDPSSDTCGPALALLELGIVEAKVIAEPRYGLSVRKAERDAELGRETIHYAPTWRHAESDETGKQAIILPVGSDDSGHDVTLSLHQLRDDEFAACVGDLVAFPIDGSRPLSRTGHTVAIGHYAVDRDRLILHANPMTWLKAHLARVREIVGDTPGLAIEQRHFPPPPPYLTSTLVIEPRAIDWRVTSARCAIPHSAREVLVPDSRALAEAIDTLMRLKERTRPLPVVRGPKIEART